MSWLEPTNLLLLACALIYGLIGEWVDGGILLLFVVGISLLDAIQQQRSNRALAELARLSAPRAHVRRDGQELELPADQVRVGDLLLLEEGDRVAADATISEAVGLWLDESLLTGESLPVDRSNPGERILAGSLVAGGRGWADVVAVAEATELGQLGKSLATVTPPPTRLQRQTRRLTSRLTVLALGFCAALALIQGGMSGNWPEALIAALALALAVLPNEIPVVLALFLALGALRLARIGVLARWPAAVESLGSATVLAVDKTGTLTENRMGVQHLLTWPELEGWQAGETLEEPFHRLVEMAVLASRGDPVDAMELAIQRLAADQLGGTEHLHPDWPLEREYPLQSDLLVFSRLWRDTGGGLQLAAKGAPEAIADLCHLEAGKSAALLSAADGLAARGLRVLAVARGLDGVQVHEGQPFPTSGALPDHVHGYLFEPVGFLALADPLRADVPAAIATARGAGVRVVMITGDSPVTARSIADQAGLPPGPVLSGHELEELTPQVLAASLREVSVFARVMPQQKLQLVRALQAAGEVVAMTGDGVNDAPALKAADIGVAMGQRGTAVARESADLVLLNDTFSDLVAALELGRRVDANLHRALGYTLAIHLPIAALGLLPLLVPGQGLILLPVHIALLHLVIDPACTVVFEALPARAGLMRQPPRPPEAPLFGPETWRHSLTQGAVVMVAALVLAFWPNAEAESRRSLVFSLLLLAGGGLVWLNGDSRSRITAAGAGIGLGLWSLLSAIPGLQQLLSLAPLQPGQILTLMITTAVALLLAWLLAPNPPLNPSPPSPWPPAPTNRHY
ncbi:cation-translocating P-type ATPase [Synechococcus sp. Tobar12-5m-g]|uniref:cation-translocating P-type ATPase n=1 Tax=unclassified Synechococcus TaxID=2626047 RepID=UPI0020CC7B0F|nr:MULTISPECIES: cation-translocating P-type ATPase [unclassified Synechococcus]MCP9773525.1 cation-translocating P-type ATPase [Synechococcus sp. Tobar12-5m-g]MCP9874490.1 cation-translocating P-type ATPase [Synechococcus sp. Cruz CV-v-12]